jgi:hypothetical protein
MNCWKCGAVLEEPFLKKLSFRATCEKCLAAQHCCSNCIYHKIGYSNECMVPDTEHVSDRTMNNFCEEFSLLGTAPKQKDDSAKQRFDALFK